MATKETDPQVLANRYVNAFAEMTSLQQRSAEAQKRWRDLRTQTDAAFNDVVKCQTEIANALVGIEEIRLALLIYAAGERESPVRPGMNA